MSPPPDGGYSGQNTAEGTEALLNLGSGTGNTGLGFRALYSNTTGGGNTANGVNALYSNTTNGGNTANGYQALFSNTTGGANTAVGFGALQANGAANANTAVGYQALYINSSGTNDNGVGLKALFSNTTGSFNNAVGNSALLNNTTGTYNTAVGQEALKSNTAGRSNTAIGDHAGFKLTTGSGNVCIGADVEGVAGESNTTRIRNIYKTVQPVVGQNPDYVTVSGGGRLGRANVSSRRYKHDIRFMEKASEGLFKLKPVSFRYREEFDPTQTVAFGLIAEDVAEVYPDLVGRTPEGRPESVRYEQINAMLLNEFLKQHRKVEEQACEMQEEKSTIDDLKGTVATQQTRIAELTATAALQRSDFQAAAAQQQKEIRALRASLKEQVSQIQRVSAQLQVNSPRQESQLVLKNQ
ncbi:MAG: tail fiber domain-containing protein [Chthoniobacterales bacterium]